MPVSITAADDGDGNAMISIVSSQAITASALPRIEDFVLTKNGTPITIDMVARSGDSPELTLNIASIGNWSNGATWALTYVKNAGYPMKFADSPFSELPSFDNLTLPYTE